MEVKSYQRILENPDQKKENEVVRYYTNIGKFVATDITSEEYKNKVAERRKLKQEKVNARIEKWYKTGWQRGYKAGMKAEKSNLKLLKKQQVIEKKKAQLEAEMKKLEEEMKKEGI